MSLFVILSEAKNLTAQDRLRAAIPEKQNSRIKRQNDRAKMKKQSV